MKAIVVRECGGPEKLSYEDISVPKPGPAEALVKVAAIGVNYIDVYYRTGLYKAEPPFTPGMEAAGTVEAVGAEVTQVKPGDRVAYAMCRGSYGEYAVVPAWQLVPLSQGVDFTAAAALMLQGMTAHYLSHSTFPLKQGDTALIHAAAGGVGLLLVQMAKMRGARVIGTAGSEAKQAMARSYGADDVVNYSTQDFEAEAKRLTGGRGVDVVYDSVGAATWEKSINSLRPRGMMVTFGNASGAVPAFQPLLLSTKGSLFVTRPTLAHHCATREELLQRSGDVLGWAGSGKLKVRIDREYPLADAAQAHRDLEARKTSGKLILKP